MGKLVLDAIAGGWLVGASTRYVRRAAAAHALHRRPAAKVRPVDTSPSSSCFLRAQEQRESGQEAVDGRVQQEVVGHVEQEDEEEEEEEDVKQVDG